MPRSKSKFKNIALSKKLAEMGWKQVADAVWERRVGRDYIARIWKTCSRAYLSVRDGLCPQLILASRQHPTVMEAAEAYPEEMLIALGSRWAWLETLTDIVREAHKSLTRSAARTKKG